MNTLHTGLMAYMNIAGSLASERERESALMALQPRPIAATPLRGTKVHQFIYAPQDVRIVRKTTRHMLIKA